MRTPFWTAWSDDKILNLKFSQLGLCSPEAVLAAPLASLRAELAACNLRLDLHFWFSTEWFTPDEVSGIALPFYLAHPRLKTLEAHQMRRAEGSGRKECMRILRHEAGHAVMNAYRLRRNPEVRAIFGASETPYPESFVPRPFSRKYVRYLGHGYAQSHPDEDFAETFAVWLDPKSDWRKRYRGWPALAKLEAMDRLMRDLAGKKFSKKTRRTIEPTHRLEVTLRTHYARRRKSHRLEPGERYDRALKRLFP